VVVFSDFYHISRGFFLSTFSSFVTLVHAHFEPCLRENVRHLFSPSGRPETLIMGRCRPRTIIVRGMDDTHGIFELIQAEAMTIISISYIEP
jgi:hypothetical protein